MKTLRFAWLSFLFPSVLGHGFLYKLSIDSFSYEGNFPNGPTSPGIIRQISDVSPVKGVQNPALTCGQGIPPSARSSAEARPGSIVTFDWRGGDLSPWPHTTGPMLTYMASCGSGNNTCASFNASTARWFKIHQVGRTFKDGRKGEWAQADLKAGAVAQVSIPDELAPGQYLLRHEIIALHLAMERGGVEFYPSCSQITILGNKGGVPDQKELVSLPGAYKDDHPGLFVSNEAAYDPNTEYSFPGPPIVHFVDAGQTDDVSSTTPPPPPRNTCRLRKHDSGPLPFITVMKRAPWDAMMLLRGTGPCSVWQQLRSSCS